MTFVAVRRRSVSDGVEEPNIFNLNILLEPNGPTLSMADWKIPVNYNYNPSYHAYAYGLMYQTGSEQNNSNLPGWAEAAYQTGANGGYYSNPQLAAPQQESPPRSPEHIAVNNVHYPGPGVLYFGDSHMQTGRLFLSHNRTELDERIKVEHVNSDPPTSDSEAHTSPGMCIASTAS